ncbi:hypothetical protein BH24BAC1_BH24BAC1_28190 [soil metagenome]
MGNFIRIKPQRGDLFIAPLLLLPQLQRSGLYGLAEQAAPPELFCVFIRFLLTGRPSGAFAWQRVNRKSWFRGNG